MKQKLFSLMLTGFILITLTTAAQNTNYPTKKINGIGYYVYKVQVSEGLLAIGRKFNISVDEITSANPETKDGLKAGQEILIPIKNQSDLEEKLPVKLNFIQHTVEKKQTLFAISHKFNISQDDLKKYNPELRNGLHEGMVLRIPDTTKVKNPVEKEKIAISSTASHSDSKYSIYKVQPNETLFSICRRYNVDINDVVRLNPGSETKIEAGTELKIPTITQVSKPDSLKPKEVVSKPKTETPVIKKTEKPIISQSGTNKVIKLAFLLPFMLDQTKKDIGLERFQNFYAGALLAIEQAKHKGISFDIHTYDTDKTEDKMAEVLKNPELTSVDLIIGPAFTNQVSLVADFAKENKVKTLIPFTAIVPDIESNPYLFKFNPGFDTEMDYLAGLIVGKFKNVYPVFINLKGISPIDAGKIGADYIRKQLDAQRRPYANIDLASPDEVDLKNFLKKGIDNLIIFNTDKYANVSPYINSLQSFINEYSIVLNEQYSWRSQVEKIPHNIFISPFITNLNVEQITEYNTQFDQFFGKDVSADSPRFDILGYDLTNYFISLIHQNENKPGNKINSSNFTKGIQSQPLFERSSNESGYTNLQLYYGEDKIQP